MTRVCTKCGEALPATLEFFYAASELKSGLRSGCKECDRLRHKTYHLAHPEKVKLWKASWLLSHPEYMPNYLANRYAARRDEICTQHGLYRQEHLEEAHARDRAYYLSHHEECDTRSKQWREDHPERTRELGRGRAKDHPEWGRNRKARKRQAVGTHTAADIAMQYERQKGRCYWCDVKVGDKYHVDHVFPLARGGSNGPENLVVACPRCNCSKRAKMPHEFSNKLC